MKDSSAVPLPNDPCRDGDGGTDSDEARDGDGGSGMETADDAEIKEGSKGNVLKFKRSPQVGVRGGVEVGDTTDEGGLSSDDP